MRHCSVALALLPEGGYTVTSPDIPTEGDTLREAPAMVGDRAEAPILAYVDRADDLPDEGVGRGRDNRGRRGGTAAPDRNRAGGAATAS